MYVSSLSSLDPSLNYIFPSPMLDRLKPRSRQGSSASEWGWDDQYDLEAGKDQKDTRLKRKLSLIFRPSQRQLGGQRQMRLGGWQFDALDETRPGRVMPGLPKELWIEIFAMASAEGFNNNSGNSKRDILAYSLVSKAWNAYSQPALYHTVHIRKSSQAKALALTLLSQICTDEGSTPSLGAGSGRHMRFLSLKTASYDRCNPSDILVILQNARHLIGFSDSGGIRCPLLDEYTDWRATPERLLERVLEGGSLRCLTYTLYPNLTLPLPLAPEGKSMPGLSQLRSLHLYLPYNADSDPYSEEVVSLHLPLLTNLTLTLSNPILSKSDGRSSMTPANLLMESLSNWSLPALRRVTINTPYALHHTFERQLGDGFWKFFQVHGRRISVLEFGRLDRPGPSPGSYSVPYSKDVLEMENRWIEAQVKDAEAEVLKLEEFTNDTLTPPSWSQDKPPSLAAMTPNLRTFICSASLSSSSNDPSWDFDFAWGGLEWDWTHPDWLAPHPLLPSHPSVRMIGIRDLGERVRADWDKSVQEREEVLGDGEGEAERNDPFFTLYHQLSSLLLPSTPQDPSMPFSPKQRENIPFPSLKYIRDLDPDSDLLRRGVRHLGKVHLGLSRSASSTGSRRRSLVVEGLTIGGLARRTPSIRAESPVAYLEANRRPWQRWHRHRSSTWSMTSSPPVSPTARFFSALTPSNLISSMPSPITRSPRRNSLALSPSTLNTVGVTVSSSTTTTSSSHPLSPSSPTSLQPLHQHDRTSKIIAATPKNAGHSPLLGLWRNVLSRTRGGEVWLEDWRGWNLTSKNLERWGTSR
ncbi:hypothetical protein D9757_001243 [Collybiopsis confluens]|uniref:F-box domain-containing protein n=1 Tax=Collybiopsis confluens TaxID=2823264 RepID=A0A8H5I0W5_9AGAR|nr:hypothetical protein D9757_001243 [Collybiopsis confluens]